eukprot:NODE_21660_length_742_cov_5.782114.p2 GENE.NODE_21660_length_742_cov_5.782114~~NODE_21660_length_742_cov_5.782114.p2  ORF type:complete len:90 (-),score=26.78 NODE_21660_length_742_cov_5.782114:402-671(-)
MPRRALSRRPWPQRGKRRRAIPSARERDEVMVTPFEEFTLESPPTKDVLQCLLNEAVDSNCHGLLLKRFEAEYEAGIPSSSWIALAQAQ